jgi:signal transduction histidine kinase
MVADLLRTTATKGQSAFRRHHLHNRLSARITFLFGLSALVLGLLVSTITYYATRSSIVGEYATAAQTAALDNGAIVREGLNEKLSGAQIVDGIDEATSDSSSLLFANGAWSLTDRLSIANLNDIPKSLRIYVNKGTPAAEQIFTLPSNGEDYIAIGQSIKFGQSKDGQTTNGPTSTARYYEVFPIGQAQNELRSLLSALIGAVLLTTVVGFLLGRWASRRTLRPLREVSEVAKQISEGKLNARIETPTASDLALLSGSFNHMVDLLQDRLVREERFTSDVSHELRSPLTTLGSSISVLESDVDEMNARSRQAVALLSQEIRRFQRMVADLLEISRIDAGSADFQRDEVFIAELVARSLRRSSSTPPPLHVDPVIAEWTVIADKRRFERIIANLIENGDRYAEGVIRVSVYPEGDDHVRIAVEDHGPGVEQEDRQHIFDRFARAAVTAGQRGKSGGTGLGLALVSEHVRLHEGTIWVEANEPQGARFIIELPRFVFNGEDGEEQ